MKIVRLGGGLGNQMLHYIFFKYLESHCGDVCYLDDSFYMRNRVHNGCELDRIFNIRPRWFRDEFTESEWRVLSQTMNTPHFFERTRTLGLGINIISGMCYYERINELYQPVEHPRGRGDVWEDPSFSEVDRIVRFQGNCYYYGQWFNSRFFESMRDEMLREFTFPPFEDEENKSMSEHIMRTNSVGLHVRRGDFVDIGIHSDAQAYVLPVGEIKRAVANPTFFIFSDDIPWCRENLAGMSLGGSDDVVFVDINRGLSSFRDMQLMSLCQHLIRAHWSTFSSMASLLMRNPDKIIAHPGR